VELFYNLNMADVAHETTPPGSWPKGKSADEASDVAPRSQPAVTKDEHNSVGDHFDEDQHESNYTHHKGVAKPDKIPEEANGLKEVDAEPISEEPEEKPVSDEKIEEEAKEAELPESSLSAKDAMAAKSKDAFDAATKKDAPETEEVEDEAATAETADVTAEPEKLDSKEAEAPVAEEKVEEVAKDEAAEREPKGEEAEEAAEEAEKLDLSLLKNAKVNKGGNLVDSDNKVVGRVKEGVIANLIGKRSDEDGNIWDNNGKIVGKAELIPDDEKEALLKEPAPFESFPDAVVDGNGMVVSGGETIGKVIEGDVKTLRGKSVDADGDILDRGGNVIGKAERWEAEPEPEPEPEAEVDRSILAGKRVNKAGNVVDSSGTIFGRVIEGNVKNMIGRMCDKKGNILSESGDIIGKAEVVAEGEREGLKEGPFAELSGCTVTKDGKVVTPGGDVVGRLVSGDPKVLFGRAVDEDGDICDKNGNVLGKAERWEEPAVEKKKNAMSGRRVNREGNVVDEDGNLIGKLTTGELSICAGKEIDDDGDVVDGKGTTIGHVSLIQDIPAPEPTESAEEKESRESIEKDRKLAAQMAGCLEQCLDKIKPICTMITEVSSEKYNPDGDRT
jgi:hypothetical protein